MRRNEASYHEQRDQFYNYSRSVDPIHPYNGPGQRLPIPRNQAKHEEMALVSHNNAHFANTPYSYPQTNYGYPFLLPGGLDRFVDRFPDRYPSHRPLVFSTPNPLETLSVKAINKMQKTCSELKVEDALGYLEEVKKKYSDNPQIYADFLQIMKKFKMKEINTECVVNMIQKLFHGNPELISAFDVFLPPEYQSDSSLLPPPLPETPAVSNPPSIKHTEHTQPVSVHTEEPPHTTISQQQIVTSNRGFLDQASRGFTQSSFDHVKLPAVNTTLPTAVYESRNSQSNDAASVKRNQSGHIDTLPSRYAYDFVNKIRNRFGKDSENFRDFLNVLQFCHTNHAIMIQNTPESREFHLKIYNEMSRILRCDSDLLDDFINFLPDFIWVPGLGEHEHELTQPVPTKRKLPPPEDVQLRVQPQTTCPEQTEPHKPPSAPKKEPKLPETPPQPIINSLTENEIDEFVRKSLNLNESNRRYYDESMIQSICKFLPREICQHLFRLMSLFNMNMLTASQLISFIKPCLGLHKSLMERLMRSILSHTHKHFNEINHASINQNEEISRGIQLVYYDNSKRFGHSYFKLKSTYIQPICSGRTEIGKQVLNDHYISQSVSSEDVPFPGSKKSSASNNLVGLETDRYDVDMIVVSTSEAIRFLESQLAKALSSKRRMSIELSRSSKRTYKELNCLKALERLYGSHVSLILEGLRIACIETLNVIIPSLKMKHENNLLNQAHLNITFAETMRKYSLKALDFQGHSFKVHENRSIRIKNLLREVEHEGDDEPDAPETTKHLVIEFNNQRTYTDAMNYVYYCIKRVNPINKLEKSRIFLFMRVIQKWMFSVDVQSNSIDEDIYNEDIGEFPSSDTINMFVNSCTYVYFRLFHLLCEKMERVFHLFMQREEEIKFYQKLAYYKTYNESCSDHLSTEEVWKEIYSSFQGLLYNIIDSTVDSQYFEEWCICNLGLKSYVLFNIDKILSSIIRQLGVIAHDQTIRDYLHSLPTTSAKFPFDFKTNEVSDRQEFIRYWDSLFDNQSCYAVQICRDPQTKAVKMKFSYVKTGPRADNASVESDVEEWTDDMQKFVDGFKRSEDDFPIYKPFLNRNSRKCKEFRNRQKLVVPSADGSNLQLDPKKAIMKFESQIDLKVNSYDMQYVSGTRDVLFVFNSLFNSRKWLSSKKFLDKIQKFRTWANLKTPSTVDLNERSLTEKRQDDENKNDIPNTSIQDTEVASLPV